MSKNTDHWSNTDNEAGGGFDVQGSTLYEAVHSQKDWNQEYALNI